MHRAQEVVHAGAGIGLLPVGVGEQLDRLDVGVAVDHAPGHGGAGVGLALGRVLQPRQEVVERAEIGSQPDQQRRRQAQVGAGHQHDHADEVDRDVQQHVEDLHHGIAHRQRRLHHLGGHPAGELVLEEGQALAEQVAVRLPADDHRVVAEQRLVDHQRHHQHGQGQHQ